MNILITGATGFFGKALTHRLHAHPKVEKIYALYRANEFEHAQRLFKGLKKLVLVHGDVTKTKVIFNSTDLKELKESVDHIFHGAGHHDLSGEYQSCFLVNVVGTQNILHLGTTFKKLRYFHHLSSFAVAGDLVGELLEDELNKGQSFSTHFAKTKFDAEFMVRNFEFGSIRPRIYRLGTVVGQSIDGSMPKIQGPYSFWRVLNSLRPKKLLLNSIKYLPMPFDKESIVPLIPLKYAIEIISGAMINPDVSTNLKCYHLVSDRAPKMGEFLQDSFDHFGFNVNVVALPSTKINDLIMDKVGLSKDLLSYLYNKCNFKSKDSGGDFSYAEFKDDLFEEVKKTFEH